MNDDYPQEKEIDHFKIWKVKDQTLKKEKKVKLFDQLNKKNEKNGGLGGSVKVMKWLANPVKKEVKSTKKKDKPKKDKPHKAEIKQGKVHLTGWRLNFDQTPKPPEGRWQIKNQFTEGEDGWEEWKIGEPEFLLVPAAKSDDPNKLPDSKDKADAEKKIDHYLCYKVDEQEFDVEMELQDQFDKKIDPTHTEPIKKLSAKYFGVPAHKDDPAPLLHHEGAHLAIYKLDPPETLFTSVATIDQFLDAKNLGVSESLYLAVPSEKRPLP
jgi:hypothetical protein